ncbi:hypothetical protein KGF57_001353 [Candida theae]|uniref:Uncharacterized protein n=1 Tax=Candida theae TaxID=1198502 RepID=A0AAD5BHR5_9ASCO|nr:uncharacterized protein KGF57_001353 [Candida theae]KAI5962913.1 hypothetical protein KGF57_001353 [Candida theae]
MGSTTSKVNFKYLPHQKTQSLAKQEIMVSKSSIVTTISLAAAAAAAAPLANPIYSNFSVIATQVIVTDYTTYCPEATTLTITTCSDNHCLPTRITVTEPSTVTITEEVLCSATSTIKPPASGSSTTQATGPIITGENTNTHKGTESTIYVPTTEVVTITSCSNQVCHPTEVKVTTSATLTTTPAITQATTPTTTNTPGVTVIPDITVFPDITPTGPQTHTDEGPVFLSLGGNNTAVTVAAASTTPANNAPAPFALSESHSSSSLGESPSIAPLAGGAAISDRANSFFIGVVVVGLALF